MLLTRQEKCKMFLHNFKTNGKSHRDELFNTAAFFDLELMMRFLQWFFIFVWKSLFKNKESQTAHQVKTAYSCADIKKYP